MDVDNSYDWCTQLAKRKAQHFYPSFELLSAPQHRAMCAVYAFMRYCDDLADDDGVADKATAISRWEQDLSSALAGNPPDHPLWPAFRDAVTRYAIPSQHFFNILKGVRLDLTLTCTASFQELYEYCYYVSSAVGLAIVHIYGFEQAQQNIVYALAEKCGIAFQLTNILRDVREDGEKGRVYLPQEDLLRFDVEPQATPNAAERQYFVYDDAFRALMQYEAARARTYYTEAQPLVNLVHPASRRALQAIIAIYSRLLELIVEAKYDVLSRTIRVPEADLARIAGMA